MTVIVALVAAVFAAPASATEQPPPFSFAFGEEGAGNGQFKSPRGIAADAKGNTWVTDWANNRVQKFDSQGKYLSQFGKFGSGNGQLRKPEGIAVDSEGNIWVVDGWTNNRVQKFNSQGEYLDQFGEEGSGNGQFSEPLDIAIDSANHVWVSDVSLNRVQQFDAEGAYLSQFGAAGSGNGQFSMPTNVAIDSNDDIWVVDNGNQRVQKFTQTGEYLTQFGAQGDGEGEFGSPWALTIDSEDNLWVTDLDNQEVQRWGVSWRIGGQTFAELGLAKAALESTGTFEIEIPKLFITFNCQEEGSGTISPSRAESIQITLSCEMVGFEECVLEPIEMEVDSDFNSLYGNILFTTHGEGCWLFDEATIVNGTGSFSYGAEAVGLDVAASHTTTFGLHTVYISGSSDWALAGSHAGKTLGIW
jgi:DNA-binding beta-propeller fold protein YncE